jgi:hypothetical protein
MTAMIMTRCEHNESACTPIADVEADIDLLCFGPIAVHQPIVETTAIGGVDYCVRKLGALNVRCDTSDRDTF